MEATLRTARRDLVIRTVHASKAKRTRAEPVAALYEQGRVHHVGTFDYGDAVDDRTGLETQLCTWEPEVADGGKHHKTPSPDRLDALVWGLTYLMIKRDPDKPPTTYLPRLHYAPSLEDRSIP